MTPETTIIASKHARKRVKERCGVGKSTAERMCNLATTRGVERSCTKGPLRKWLNAKYQTQGKGSIYVWGDKAYLVSEENVCITVLNIPNELKKNLKRMFIMPELIAE